MNIPFRLHSKRWCPPAREVWERINRLMAEAKKNTGSTTVVAQSAADELLKFKNLCDMGVITQEEFEAKKKQLLGL